MTKDYIADIQALLKNSNPLQEKKFAAFLSGCDTLYYQRANRFFAQYERVLNQAGKDFSYSVECYNMMIAEMLYERISFMETGKYSNTSFDDVRKKLYENPEAFDHHMHGLALAQFIWWDQYQRFSFFADNLPSYREQTKRYLEIGAGHGLFISEALRQFKESTHFDLVDISPTSIQMSKIALDSTPRINYMLADIYDYRVEKKYDFITIGEVIEHLEEPGDLMHKLKDILNDDGVIYLTTPANAPMIDHIYLFKSADEIRKFILDSGFVIEKELAVFAENMEEKKALKNKIPLMFAAFIRKS